MTKNKIHPWDLAFSLFVGLAGLGTAILVDWLLHSQKPEATESQAIYQKESSSMNSEPIKPTKKKWPWVLSSIIILLATLWGGAYLWYHLPDGSWMLLPTVGTCILLIAVAFVFANIPFAE